MKKLAPMAAAVALILVPAMAEGQNATVKATASIDAFAEWVGTYDEVPLIFGTLSSDATDADRTITTVATDVKLDVNYNTDFYFTFDGLNDALENQDDAALTIGLTHYCEWVANGGTAGGATDCDLGDVTGASGATTGTLHIGGKLDDLSNAAPGTYEAILTVNIVLGTS